MSQTKYISFNNGRFGNQLYYALQAYIKSTPDQKYIYSMRSQEAELGIFDMIQALGLDDLVTVDHPSVNTDSYCQYIKKDFTIEQLNSFIKEKILKSDVFCCCEQFKEYEDTVLLHIRNGDYLAPEKGNYHDCFDRMDFLSKAIQIPKISHIKKIRIFSDDIELCKKLYDNILSKRFDVISYDEDKNTLSQFSRMSMFKNKILWNSTFAFWAGFIGNVIYNNQSLIIVPDKFTRDMHILTRVPPEWTIVKVIPK